MTEAEYKVFVRKLDADPTAKRPAAPTVRAREPDVSVKALMAAFALPQKT